MTRSEYSAQYERYLREVEDTIFSSLPATGLVAEAMRYAVTGGKRVRGVAVLAIAELLGGLNDDCRRAAAALECVHAYSLVHDDLPCMDNDDMRRGRPSCHRQFGETTALLAGDGLLTHAFSLIGDMASAEAGRDCARALSAAAGASGMILGQEIDLSPERPQTLAQLDRLHSHKTGDMFAACARLAAAATGRGAHTETLESFMRSIGLVFQIVDDVLDVTSTDEVLGKPVHSDEKNGKVTYLSFMSINECRELAGKLTADAVAALKADFTGCDFLEELANSLAVRVC